MPSAVCDPPSDAQVAWDVIWSGDRATVVGVSSRKCPITTALVRAAFHDAGTFNS